MVKSQVCKNNQPQSTNIRSLANHFSSPFHILITSAQDVYEEDRGGGPAPVQERRGGHGARPDHGDQHVPDLLRVGTHGAVRGALISAGVHHIPAQRPSVRVPEEVDAGDRQFEDPGISQIVWSSAESFILCCYPIFSWMLFSKSNKMW